MAAEAWRYTKAAAIPDMIAALQEIESLATQRPGDRALPAGDLLLKLSYIANAARDALAKAGA